MALQRRSRLSASERRDAWGDLAAVVGTRRQELGLTQAELADLAGVSARFVHAVENGAVNVGLDRLLEVLATLGLHLQVERGEHDDVRAGPRLARELGWDAPPPPVPGAPT